jgi:hypothetical protein
MTTSTLYRLIVDTTSYAGNFERQSVAFATGLVGECGVGNSEAEQAKEEMSPSSRQWWQEHGLQLPDDEEYPCMRPAAIYPTPGLFNNGVGGNFPTTDEGRAQSLVAYRASVAAYEAQNQARLGSVEVGKNGWTQEAVDRELRASHDKVAASLALEKVNEHPSYQSVAVCTDAPPPPEVAKEFAERMRVFMAKQKVEIIDIAMQVETTKMEVEVRRSLRTGL